MSEELCTCNNVPADQCTCDAGCVCGCKPVDVANDEDVDATGENVTPVEDEV